MENRFTGSAMPASVQTAGPISWCLHLYMKDFLKKDVPMRDLPNSCENCGAGLTHEMNHCGSCGHSIPLTSADTASGPPTAATVCPVCGCSGMSAADVIAKYEKIPDKENPTDAEEDEEIKRMEVIDYLTQPEKPKIFSVFNWILLLFIPFVNLISVFCSPLVKSLKIFMSLATLVFIGFVLWYATGTFDDPFAARDIVYMAGFGWAVLYIICLLISKFSVRKKYPARLAEYEKASQRWQLLRYCEACDKVYCEELPGKTAPVAETKSFLIS
jgi:hypothetical protein